MKTKQNVDEREGGTPVGAYPGMVVKRSDRVGSSTAGSLLLRVNLRLPSPVDRD